MNIDLVDAIAIIRRGRRDAGVSDEGLAEQVRDALANQVIAASTGAGDILARLQALDLAGKAAEFMRMVRAEIEAALTLPEPPGGAA